jgi:rhodanese-related sulfurtransferase
MYGLFGGGEVRDLTPEEVASGIKSGEILLVDVREPNETAVERIPGAVLLPLSTFDPTDLPDAGGRALVFSCASGIRSVKAAEIAQAAGLPHNAHLAGGLKAWKAAGLPTEC